MSWPLRPAFSRPSRGAAGRRPGVVPPRRALDADGVERTWHVLDNRVGGAGRARCCASTATRPGPTSGAGCSPRHRRAGGWSRRTSSAWATPSVRRPRTLAAAGRRPVRPDRGPRHHRARWSPSPTTGAAPSPSAGRSSTATSCAALVLTNTAVQIPEGTAGPAVIRLASTAALRDLACVRTPAFVEATGAPVRPAGRRARRPAVALRDARPSARPSATSWPTSRSGRATRPGRRSTRSPTALPALDVPALLLWGPRDPVFGEAYLADLRERLPQAPTCTASKASPPGDRGRARLRELRVWQLGQLASRRRRPDPAAPRRIEPARRSGRRSTSAPTITARPSSRSAAAPSPGTSSTGGWSRSRPGWCSTAFGPATGSRCWCRPAPTSPSRSTPCWRAGARHRRRRQGPRRARHGPGAAQRAGRPRHRHRRGAGRARGRCGCGRPASDRRWAVRTGCSAPSVSLADLATSWARARRGDLPEPPGRATSARCVFTSGATGPAKGVVYRHGQLRAQVALIRSTYAPDRDDRIVAAFAPFALYGPALGIGSAVPDMDVTAPGTLTAVALAEAVAALDATVVFASPAALRNVLATADELTASPSQGAVAGAAADVRRRARARPRCSRRLAGVLPGRRPAHAVRDDRGAAGHRHLPRADRAAGEGERRLRRAAAARGRGAAQPAGLGRRRPMAS